MLLPKLGVIDLFPPKRGFSWEGYMEQKSKEEL